MYRHAFYAITAYVALMGLWIPIASANDDAVASNFSDPPASARPWVYWFWLNGNITPEGITADLEAMQRAGIGGVLIMEVDQNMPVGPVDFMGPRWRELFRFVCQEADRLGLEVNMNDCAGWNGSSGPWITPELSMQQLTWSELTLVGDQRFEGMVPQPATNVGYYRDIAVLAFPAPQDDSFRIPGIERRALSDGTRDPFRRAVPTDSISNDPKVIIPQDGVLDLSGMMDDTGKLTWQVPTGRWTVVRFGHTSTGADGRPSPATGNGLECDKLSKAGSEAAFAGMMGKLIQDVGPLAGKSLVRTHIDSWENGVQNWTATMRDEFRRRRGYDLQPFLPVVTGRVVGSADVSDRFLWDFRQTINELTLENYADHMREMANAHGLELSIEAYDGTCDDLPYAGRADEPMSEFWIGGMRLEFAKAMASAAHLYGRRIVGAEAFTAGDQERWLEHPGSIKALGDRAFCGGINRFVFHRYAMQPWVDEHLVPGMMMGPWGLHYERTNTWWEQSKSWHTYLARCQYLLSQGEFVADICYLQAERPPQGVESKPRDNYDYDVAPSEIVMQMHVDDGRIVAPSGMNYRVLVLPDTNAMTPGLLAKIQQLIRSGATVIGTPPLKSPSLADYPQCDRLVQSLCQELWGDVDVSTAGEREIEKGRLIWGASAEQVLEAAGIGPDFQAPRGIDWIHRKIDGRDIYFVANTTPTAVNVDCRFRVTSSDIQLWNAETGRIQPALHFQRDAGFTTVTLPMEPMASVFVVFHPDRGRLSYHPVTQFTRNDQPVTPHFTAACEINQARYGVLSDPARTRDVTAKVQAKVDAGDWSFLVADMAQDDDPAYGTVKTLKVMYRVDSELREVQGTDPQRIDLLGVSSPPPVARLVLSERGAIALQAWQDGHYRIRTSAEETLACKVTESLKAIPIDGSWNVQFPTGWGAPEVATFDKLQSWSDMPQDGVRHFSGTAEYHRTLQVGPELLGDDRRLELDLGDVQVIADVSLNGHPLGTLWKRPYRLDITQTVRAGENDLKIAVTNLWPNRLIGDERIPADGDRNPNGTLKRWPEWLLAGKNNPTERFTFSAWRLWNQNDALLPAGLIGPVQLLPSAILDFTEESAR